MLDFEREQTSKLRSGSAGANEPYRSTANDGDYKAAVGAARGQCAERASAHLHGNIRNSAPLGIGIHQPLVNRLAVEDTLATTRTPVAAFSQIAGYIRIEGR